MRWLNQIKKQLCPGLTVVCHYKAISTTKANDTGLNTVLIEVECIQLKAARSALDMSQGDLAEKVGVTRQTIGLIELGKYNPTLSVCIAICKALNKTLDELFWEEEN